MNRPGNFNKAAQELIGIVADELISHNHGKGKFCDECGKRKDTEKVNNKYLCVSCRTGVKKPIQSVYNSILNGKNEFMCWCGNIHDVAKASTCKTCGKMLCGLCGDYCNDHLGGAK